LGGGGFWGGGGERYQGLKTASREGKGSGRIAFSGSSIEHQFAIGNRRLIQPEETEEREARTSPHIKGERSGITREEKKKRPRICSYRNTSDNNAAIECDTEQAASWPLARAKDKLQAAGARGKTQGCARILFTSRRNLPCELAQKGDDVQESRGKESREGEKKRNQVAQQTSMGEGEERWKVGASSIAFNRRRQRRRSLRSDGGSILKNADGGGGNPVFLL